jgi:hypothetical protein
MKELSTDAWAVVLVAVILFLFMLGIVGQADYEEELLQQDIYCEFVDLWGQTNGRDGHPDFRGIYETACTDGQRRD